MSKDEIIGGRRWILKRKYKSNTDEKKQGTGGQKSCRAVIDLDSSQIKIKEEINDEIIGARRNRSIVQGCKSLKKQIGKSICKAVVDIKNSGRRIVGGKKTKSVSDDKEKVRKDAFKTKIADVDPSKTEKADKDASITEKADKDACKTEKADKDASVPEKVNNDASIPEKADKDASKIDTAQSNKPALVGNEPKKKRGRPPSNKNNLETTSKKVKTNSHENIKDVVTQDSVTQDNFNIDVKNKFENITLETKSIIETPELNLVNEVNSENDLNGTYNVDNSNSINHDKEPSISDKQRHDLNSTYDVSTNESVLINDENKILEESLTTNVKDNFIDDKSKTCLQDEIKSKTYIQDENQSNTYIQIENEEDQFLFEKNRIPEISTKNLVIHSAKKPYINTFQSIKEVQNIEFEDAISTEINDKVFVKPSNFDIGNDLSIDIFKTTFDQVDGRFIINSTINEPRQSFGIPRDSFGMPRFKKKKLMQRQSKSFANISSTYRQSLPLLNNSNRRLSRQTKSASALRTSYSSQFFIKFYTKVKNMDTLRSILPEGVATRITQRNDILCVHWLAPLI